MEFRGSEPATRNRVRPLYYVSVVIAAVTPDAKKLSDNQ